MLHSNFVIRFHSRSILRANSAGRPIQHQLAPIRGGALISARVVRAVQQVLPAILLHANNNVMHLIHRHAHSLLAVAFPSQVEARTITALSLVCAARGRLSAARRLSR